MIAAALFIALGATAINEYRFAVHDQAQYLVQVIDAAEPAALGPDPYRDAFAALGSVFWTVIGRFVDEASLPIVALGLTLAIAMANALVVWRIGRAMIQAELPRNTGRVWMAIAAFAPALILMVPKEDNWFGLVSLSDSELTATLGVMPVVFAVMLLVVHRRMYLALAVAACAAPIQGQTAAYLLSATWVAALIQVRGTRSFFLLGMIGVAGAAGLVAAAISFRVDPDLLVAYEGVGLGLYPELINPLHVPAASWAAMFGVLGLGAGAFIGLARASDQVSGPVGRLALWGAASMVLPMVGIAGLALGVREPILWKLMVGRAFMLPQLVSLLLVAVWCVVSVVRARGPIGITVVAGVLALVSMWSFPRLGLLGAGACIGALCVIMITLPMRGATAVALNPLIRPLRWRLAACIGPSAALAMVLGVVVGIDGRFPWLRSGQEHAWLEAQRWARAHTSPGALFVTPPYLSDWRIESHRGTYGEIKDGCLLFYSGAPVLEWSNRMAQLGMNGCYTFFEARRPDSSGTSWRARYEDAVETQAAVLASTSNEVFVVADRSAWDDEGPGQRVWWNDAFQIRRLTGTVVAHAVD